MKKLEFTIKLLLQLLDELEYNYTVSFETNIIADIYLTQDNIPLLGVSADTTSNDSKLNFFINRKKFDQDKFQGKSAYLHAIMGSNIYTIDLSNPNSIDELTFMLNKILKPEKEITIYTSHKFEEN